MEVRNCKGCGRLFNVLGTEKLCSACRQGLEDKFQEVKKFLDENPNSSVETVSREMDVSTKQIRQWVREERLIFSEGSMEGIECEMCGAMIRTGRYCEKCKAGKQKESECSAFYHINPPAGGRKKAFLYFTENHAGCSAAL